MAAGRLRSGLLRSRACTSGRPSSPTGCSIASSAAPSSVSKRSAIRSSRRTAWPRSSACSSRSRSRRSGSPRRRCFARRTASLPAKGQRRMGGGAHRRAEGRRAAASGGDRRDAPFPIAASGLRRRAGRPRPAGPRRAGRQSAAPLRRRALQRTRGGDGPRGAERDLLATLARDAEIAYGRGRARICCSDGSSGWRACSATRRGGRETGRCGDERASAVASGMPGVDGVAKRAMRHAVADKEWPLFSPSSPRCV